MTPSILLTRDGQFAGAIGSAGGNAILAYVAKSLVAAIDWNMPMRQALAAPNLVARGPNFQGEVDKFSSDDSRRPAAARDRPRSPARAKIPASPAC